MLLAAIIDAAGVSNGSNPASLKPSPGIHEAMQLLEWLSGLHNRAATVRVQQMLGLYRRIPSLMEAVNLPEDTNDPDRVHSLSRVEGTVARAYSPENYDPNIRMSGASMEELDQSSLPIEFPTNPHDMYSLYHDEDFVLTGADMADFEVLQRHLFGDDT